MKKLALLFLLFVLVWVPLQDFTAAILFRAGVPVEALRIILISKDMVAITIFCLITAKLATNKDKDKDRIVLIDIGMLAFLMLTVLYVGYGYLQNYDISSIVTGGRNCAFPAILYFIGRNISTTDADIKRIFYVCALVSLGLSTFGFIEYLLLPPEIWAAIGIGYVENTIRGISGDAIDGAYLNMYGLLGRRLVSFFGNPLFFSYFSIPLVGIFMGAFLFRINNPTRPRGVGLLALTALTLAVSRGVLASLFISTVIISAVFYRRALLPLALFSGLIIALFSEKLVETYDAITSFADASAFSHHGSTLRGIDLVLEAPFGKGIGAYSFGLSTDFLANENAFLTVAYQMGIFGSAILIAIMLGASIYLLRMARIQPASQQYSKMLISGVGIASLAYFMTGFASDLFLTFKGAGHFWALLGAVVSISLRDTSEVEKDGEGALSCVSA